MSTKFLVSDVIAKYLGTSWWVSRGETAELRINFLN